MEILNKSTFKEKVFDFEKGHEWDFKGNLPTIVDFYADWCGPCRQLAPILEEIASEYEGRLNVYKVNTEKDPELAAMFGVRGIPALLFIPKKGEPSMSSGFMPKDLLKGAIKEVLNV